MNRLLIRIVTLVLVPGLLMEPAAAASLTRALSPTRETGASANSYSAPVPQVASERASEAGVRGADGDCFSQEAMVSAAIPYLEVFTQGLHGFGRLLKRLLLE